MRQSWGAFPSLRWVQWSLFAACIVVLWENICFAQSDVPDLSLDQLRAEPLLKDFDWKAYAQIHSDLHVAKITTEFDLRQHYWKSGRFEGRAFPKTVPNEPQAAFALKKIMNFVSFLDKHSVPMQERTLMVFHIGKPDMKNSLEVIINNLHIFQSSIDLDTAGSSGIFYLFNIVDGNENMYFKFLNTSNFNVGWNVWSATPSDIYTHLRTMNIYQDVLLKSFGSIFFLNNGVRGPLLDRAAGKWMQPFRKLLFANNVGMVGSTLSCELAPHIQTHFFGLLTSIIPIVLKEYDAYRTFDTWPALIRYYEVDLTGFIRNSGYNVASLFYQKRIGQQYFQNGTCLKADKFVNDHTVDNPSRWCDIVPEEVMLFKWGGDMLRTNGFICSLTKQRMQDVLVDLSHQMPAKYELEIPETLRGGSYFDLYKQYEHETFRDRLISPEPSTTSSSNSAATSNTAVVSMAASPQGDGRGGKVCFLVRPSVYDLQRPVTSLVNSDYFRGFSNLVQSLRRQTDAQWEAFFIPGDPKAVDSYHETLYQFNDSRISILHGLRRPRRQFQSIDEPGSLLIDNAIKKLFHKAECSWIVVTNAENVYGSRVVELVRAAAHRPIPSLVGRRTPFPDMILVPIDSKSFHHREFNAKASNVMRQGEYCKDFHNMMELSLMGYTIQPRPMVGRIDLAGLFFLKDKLAQENVFFMNFTAVSQYPCKTCQDGYMASFLTAQRGWKYHKLPIDGLSSMAFHGPSPLWCVAAGHIWFSHPDPYKARCYTQRTVDAIRKTDIAPGNDLSKSLFDWVHFDQVDRLCIRLSTYGFQHQQQLV